MKLLAIRWYTCLVFGLFLLMQITSAKEATITLITGEVLKNVEIVSVGTDTVMARWDGGRGTIQQNVLPDELRAKIEMRRPVAVASTTPQPKPTTVHRAKVSAAANKGANQAAPVEDNMRAEKRREAKRVQLLQIIERNQKIIERYDHQSASYRKNAVLVSEQQCEEAKAARDKAQRERDELAR